MSFYLRKAVRVGPLRFNLSSSGVGVSTGVKGFRVGNGPRGNYVHMGAGGLYYRTTLGPKPKHRSSQPTRPQPSEIEHVEMREIESVSTEGMLDSSSRELLAELLSKRKRIRLLPWVLVLVAACAFVLAFQRLPLWALALAAVLAAALAVIVGTWDNLRKTTVIFYRLDPGPERAYDVFHHWFDQVAACARVWHIPAAGAIRDRKYHGGASTLVKRDVIHPRKGSVPYIKTNIQVPQIVVGRQTLAFFPDRLLVLDSSGVGAVSYANLRVDNSTTRFVETSGVPADAKVVGRTWRYVNKSGGPDRRFKDNPEIPLTEYSEIHFSSASGLNELLQLSRLDVTDGFRQALAALGQHEQNDKHHGV